MKKQDKSPKDFQPTRLENYKDATILEEIRRVANLLDEKPLTVISFDKESRVNHTTVTRKFGSWKNALLLAKLDTDFIYNRNKKITKQDIVDELIRVSIVLKKQSFTANEFDQISKMSRTSKAFYREFGSFKKAMEEAGLQSPTISKRYSDEERFENLLNVWTHHGRQPKYNEMKLHPSVIGPKSYLTRWGSWTKAIYAFVEYANQDIPILENNAKPKKYLEKQIVSANENRREIKLGLRYQILSRDHFKCKRCGDSPATNSNCKLHVDHIIPFSKGGKTISENLQTLCEKCNIGKGNRYSE